MITYGDLFPYHKVTLGDLVNSGTIEEEDALQVVGLLLKNFKVRSLFGKQLHDITAVSKTPYEKATKIKDLFACVEESYQSFLNLMDNFPVTFEMVNRYPRLKRKIGLYAKFNKDLSERISSHSFFKKKFEDALKKYNLYLNPFFTEPKKNGILLDYQTTIVALFEFESNSLLDELRKELIWINLELFHESTDFIPLIKSPQNLVHYYALFFGLMSKHSEIVGDIVQNYELAY